VRTTKQQARLVGILYLGMLVAPIGLIYVPNRLIVPGDATATADNLRASEGLLRLGMASELAHQVVALFLVLALYYLFESVDRRLARQVVVLGALVSVPILFVNVLNEVAAAFLARGPDALAALGRPQLDALAYLFLHLHGKGIAVASIFWGLWLFPYGLLVIRSRFIPRFLGVLLIAAGAAYLASACATLLLPRFAPLVARIAMPFYFGELPIFFWYLIWGARPQPGDAAARPSPGS
jgi:hypothetical protein